MKSPHLLRHYVQFVFHALLGDFSWRPPFWLRRSGERVAQRPFVSLLMLAAFVAASVGGWFLWNGWKHRPVPLESDWIVQAPQVPEADHTFAPQPLWITFDRSVASLAEIDKPSVPGVTLSPDMPGTWRWTGGTRLMFEPRRDWPAGTDYRVTLAKSLFSPRARLTTFSKTFHTAPFAAQISDLVFYINPKDASTKQVTGTLTFSHAVSRDSLARQLQTSVVGAEPIFAPGQAPFTLTYDKRDRVVYFRSASIVLPKNSTFFRLTLPESIRAAAGDATLAGEVHNDVLVPSNYDLFHISGAQVVIVKDKDAEPSQALIVTTSVGVQPEALDHHIHAYVLPPRHDSQHAVIPWNGPAEIDAKVRAGAREVDLIRIPSDQAYTSAPSYRVKVPENAQLYITIDHGIQALGGFPLKDDYQGVCQVPAFEREVRLMYDGSLLALNGDRKLSVSSRGVDEIEYRLARVNPGEINHLVSQSEGSFSSPVFSSDNFGENDLAESIVRRVSLADANPGVRNYSALDFSEFLDGRESNQGRLGLFILHAYGRKSGSGAGYYTTDGAVLADRELAKQTNEQNGEPMKPQDNGSLLSDRRLILVTDLGLIIKDNADQTHDVFVQSIKTGDPVDGAKVSVLGKNGLTLLTVETDSQGRAPIPSLGQFDHEKRPVAYVAQLGRDISFLPFGRADRELNLSRFDTSGLEGIKPADLLAYLFTDRGIYRPGDSVKIGLIVKQHNWLGNPAGVPLELDITDPRGQQVETRIIKCDATGFMESTYVTRETTLTGLYTADLYLARGAEDKTLLGEESFRVKDFLPDRLKIAAQLTGEIPEGWVAQKGLQAGVTLRNLYGSVAAGNRIRGKLTLTPSQFGFAKYPDYKFTDPYLDPNTPRKSYEMDLPEQDTDANGAALFALDATGMEASAYQLSFLAEGFEKAGGRSVTAYVGVLVSPSPWLLGTKPDGDLTYVDHDSRRSVRLLAVDPHLKPIAIDHLTLKLAERRYVAVLEQEPNGNYGYESVLKEIPVEQAQIALAAGGTDWPVKSDVPGDYAARFYNEQGDLMADVRYSRRRGGQPDAGAGEECRVDGPALKTGVQGGRGDRGADHCALYGRWPDHDRARQGLRRAVVQGHVHLIGAKNPGARRLRGQWLSQHCVRPRPGFEGNLHEPAELRRAAVQGGPGGASHAAHHRRPGGGRAWSAADVDRDGQPADARGRLRGRRRHPAGRRLPTARSARLLLPQGGVGRGHAPDGRPDPARVFHRARSRGHRR